MEKMTSHKRPDSMRVDRACFTCHKSKLSCDSERPCKRCRDSNKPHECVDRVAQKRGRKAKRSKLLQMQPFTGDGSSSPTYSLPPVFSSRLFSSLFALWQDHFHFKKPLLHPYLLSLRVRTWQQMLSDAQVHVILSFIASHGDHIYRSHLQQMISMPDPSITPIQKTAVSSSNSLSPMDKSITPAFLELLPVASNFTVFDHSCNGMNLYVNERYLQLFELSRVEFYSLMKNDPNNYLARFFDESELERYTRISEQVSLCQGRTLQLTSRLRTFRERTIPVHIFSDIEYTKDGNILSVLTCLQPISETVVDSNVGSAVAPFPWHDGAVPPVSPSSSSPVHGLSPVESIPSVSEASCSSSTVSSPLYVPSDVTNSFIVQTYVSPTNSQAIQTVSSQPVCDSLHLAVHSMMGPESSQLQTHILPSSVSSSSDHSSYFWSEPPTTPLAGFPTPAAADLSEFDWDRL